MQDRYLFRGKRIDNGEWVEGFLFCADNYAEISNVNEHCVKVDPLTVCQCTGLRDKKGELIWENDIVKDKNGNLYKAFWQDNYYQFSWICIKSNSLPVGAKWDFYSIKRFEIEVIGNVFDNPELLEAQE